MSRQYGGPMPSPWLWILGAQFGASGLNTDQLFTNTFGAKIGDNRSGFYYIFGAVISNWSGGQDVAGITVNAGSFLVGSFYQILTIGTTDFTLIGAASNTVGVRFTATGVGSGTGTANQLPKGGIFDAAAGGGNAIVPASQVWGDALATGTIFVPTLNPTVCPYTGPTPPTYSAATAYIPGNYVVFAGTIYLCTANTTGNAPPNASFWLNAGTGTLLVGTPRLFLTSTGKASGGSGVRISLLGWDISGTF